MSEQRVETSETAASLDNLVKDVSVESKDGIVCLTGKYSPSAEHCRRFVEITGDRNPLHLIPYEGHFIAPGLLQTTFAFLFSRRALAERNYNIRDYPFSADEADMKLPVISGGNYPIDASLKEENEQLHFDLWLNKNRNNPAAYAYHLKREMKPKKPKDFFPLANPNAFVYRQLVNVNEKGMPTQFGKLIGSESSESHLCALALSSSGIFSALDKRKFPPLAKGIVALYTNQKIFMDSSKTLVGNGKIALELYLSGEKEFSGEIDEKSGLAEMSILARDAEGKLIYMVNCILSFQDKERIAQILIRRALRGQKD
jgi:hypothetical protein